MGFRLVPKSVTLDDLERRNDRYLSLFIDFGSFGADCRYVNVVEDRPRPYTVYDKNVVQRI